MTNATPDFRAAARGQLFFARMAREQGNLEAADAHERLANTYIQQELRKVAK